MEQYVIVQFQTKLDPEPRPARFFVTTQDDYNEQDMADDIVSQMVVLTLTKEQLINVRDQINEIV